MSLVFKIWKDFVTGHIMKGGVRLPVFRCSRGKTSLESFHLHWLGKHGEVFYSKVSSVFARFIPGSSASARHFQAFLLEGLSR